MRFKSLYIAVIIFLILPIRGCKNEAISPSIVEFDCRKNINSVMIPGTPGMKIKASQCSDYIFKPKVISKAINLFVERYADYFEMSESKVWNLLEGLTIEVSLIPRTVVNVYDINGKLMKKQTPVSGLAFSKYLIWVEIRTNQIWSSSLAHELVHIIIWRSNGVHGDPDHEGPQFSGWNKKHTKFIKDFNIELLELDM